MKRLHVTLLALIFALTCFSQQRLEFVSIDELPMDQDAQKYKKYYDDEKICALVKVQLRLKDVKFENDFIVGDVEFKTNEYWVYMAEGAAKLDIKHPNYPKLTVNFVNANNEPIKLKQKYTYSLAIDVHGTESKSVEKPIIITQNVKNFGLRIGGMYEIGGLQGIGGMVGVSFKGLQFDFNYIAGLKKSDNVYWNNTSMTSSASYSYQYTPSFIGGKLGYRIRLGSPNFTLSPQVGFGSVLLNGKVIKTGTNNPNATNGYATVGSIGAEVSLRFAKILGVFVTPQYNMAFSKSDLFSRVEEVSSNVKSFASGFNLQLGLYVSF